MRPREIVTHRLRTAAQNHMGGGRKKKTANNEANSVDRIQLQKERENSRQRKQYLQELSMQGRWTGLTIGYFIYQSPNRAQVLGCELPKSPNYLTPERKMFAAYMKLRASHATGKHNVTELQAQAELNTPINNSWTQIVNLSTCGACL